MFKVKEIAGQLIKSGRFGDASYLVAEELSKLVQLNLITPDELNHILQLWAEILLDPSNFDFVQGIGDKFIQLAIRIPGYIEEVTEEEYRKNVKNSYGTI